MLDWMQSHRIPNTLKICSRQLEPLLLFLLLSLLLLQLEKVNSNHQPFEVWMGSVLEKYIFSAIVLFFIHKTAQKPNNNSHCAWGHSQKYHYYRSLQKKCKLNTLCLNSLKGSKEYECKNSKMISPQFRWDIEKLIHKRGMSSFICSDKIIRWMSSHGISADGNLPKNIF